MKSLRTFLFFTVVLCSFESRAQSITYVSPVPNSQFNSRETNIILRSAENVDASTVSANDIRVSGSLSGTHSGTFTLSDDQQTLLFHPKNSFTTTEDITVAFQGEVRTVTGKILDPKNYSFNVTSQSEPLSRQFTVNERGEVTANINFVKTSEATNQTISPVDSLPADFPKFKLDTTNNPAPGYFFLGTADDVAGIGSFVFMVDNNGSVVKWKRTGNHHTYDFKVQRNGLLSYAEAISDWGYAGGSRTIHRVMDSSFAAVDSFRAGNGYDADSHEFIILPNGHVLLHAYDIQYFDLSLLDPKGNMNAIVVGSIMQELDLKKNVVFQWRSWDYVPITETYFNLAGSAFDYIHINGYDLDDDGNIIVSFRNTCQIAKIDRMTGKFIWRLGGKKNQFAFVGENEANAPTYFSYQHSVKKLPNGNILMFDNGNLHPVQYTRAVEYRLDTVAKTSTRVWEYRHVPDLYAPTRGSVQRLENGNTVIGWGSARTVGAGGPAVTEVRPDKSVVFELSFVDKMSSFRTHKFVWNAHMKPAGNVTIAEVLPGNEYSFNLGDTNRTGITVKLNDATFGYNTLTVKKYQYAPQILDFPEMAPVVRPVRFVVEQTGITSFTADITFDSTLLLLYPDMNKTIIYAREFEGNGLFIPLTSVYNAAKKSLTITTTKFGEFIIGVPDIITIPLQPTPVTPLQNGLVNQTKPVLIRWSTRGHITGSHLQISKDSAFAAAVYNDSTLLSSYALWNGFEPYMKYYWRANAVNELGKSGWSTVGTFTTSGPYISILYPTVNLTLIPNNSYQLKYENNIEERVNIRLYRNGSFVLKIKDSTENTGRYVWKVPITGLAVDSTFTIKVRSVLDSTIEATSPMFSITAPTGVKPELTIVSRFELLQNYPNPFNPVTIIGYQMPSKNFVSLKIFDVLGKEITTLVNQEKEPGTYSVQFDAGHLSSGIYYYTLTAGSFSGTKKLILVK